MSNRVLTTHGLIELSQLDVSDHVEIGDGYRKVIVQYRLDDEIVRQSVFVDLLRPNGADAVPGTLNGR